ncbi:MAG: hypothetical protein ACRDLP_08645 [Solirubrobacteraceae bacterium]
MEDTKDWRLRVDIGDPSRLHALLRDARRVEHDAEAAIPDDVVLDRDDETLFAYAMTRAAIDETRRAIERVLADDGVDASVTLSHWNAPTSDWRQVDPPPDATEREHEAQEDRENAAAEQRDERIVTRTVAETAGKLVRNFFETTVADEARARGVTLSIVEHPHLLTTQIAFTLTGPAGAVDDVIADLQARAGGITRIESANLTPI